jgi:hypothetical protein
MRPVTIWVWSLVRERPKNPADLTIGAHLPCAGSPGCRDRSPLADARRYGCRGHGRHLPAVPGRADASRCRDVDRQ